MLSAVSLSSQMTPNSSKAKLVLLPPGLKSQIPVYQDAKSSESGACWDKIWAFHEIQIKLVLHGFVS